MTFATEMREMMDELLTEFGNAAVFKNITSSPIDPTTGTVAKVTADEPATVSGPVGFDPRLIDGTMIQARDAEIQLSAEGLAWEPDVNERVVIDSKTWTVIAKEPIRVQDTNVGWRLQIR